MAAKDAFPSREALSIGLPAEERPLQQRDQTIERQRPDGPELERVDESVGQGADTVRVAFSTEERRPSGQTGGLGWSRQHVIVETRDEILDPPDQESERVRDSNAWPDRGPVPHRQAGGLQAYEDLADRGRGRSLSHYRDCS